ncbi:collagen alpha-1(I) chain-like [Chiroxiphia lanceolata]|uniref:collagen alpha-1(I) chain-like n=1 Tax=Chiroxiphia lanceolata TaxID=296741 RepID=UPI0013CE3EBD|nr:collagen alpha-1(I) chain-like [Chiroxiphia lanceolata]
MEAPRSARAPAAPPGCPSRGGGRRQGRGERRRLCRTFCLSLRSQRGALRPARDRPPVKRCERTGGGTAPGPGTAGTAGAAGPRPGSGAERPGPRCPAEVPPVRPRGAEGAGTAPVPSRRLAAPRARRRRGVSRLGSPAKCGLSGLAGTWLRPSLGGAGKQGPEGGLASPSIRPCIHLSLPPSIRGAIGECSDSVPVPPDSPYRGARRVTRPDPTGRGVRTGPGLGTARWFSPRRVPTSYKRRKCVFPQVFEPTDP